MNSMLKKLEQVATGKIVFILGAIFVAVLLFLKMWFGPYFLTQTNGNIYLEQMIIYSPTDLYKLLSAYGQAGRDFYIKSSLTLDFVIPFQYSTFFTLCTIWIIKKLSMRTTWKVITFILGIILCLSDCLENIFLISIIHQYPKQLFSLAYIACASTLIKTALTTLFFVIIAVGFALLLWRVIVSRGKDGE